MKNMLEAYTDKELFALMKEELYTAVVTDVMDTMNLCHQFLPPAIQPFREEMMLAGRAMPVLEADCCGETIGYINEKKSFGLMFEALDSLKENEVYICTGASPTYACFGELMATRAIALGAAGAVVGGYIRDTRKLKDMPLPIFSHGRYAQDQGIRGRVIDYNCPIEFPNHVRVEPGDIVFGDMDGVVIIPKKHETAVLQKALEKVRGEHLVKDALEQGMSTVEAFRKFGIM